MDFKKTRLCLAALLCLMSSSALSENWLGSRFASNCSSCHSPGRRNLPEPDRRCALSCQGCHINPSGGGVRNFYGKWTENQWLKSFRSKKLKQRATTAYVKKQKNHIPNKEYLSGKASKKIRERRKITKDPFPLVRAKKEPVDESLYLKDVDDIMYVVPNAEDREEFLYTLAEGDPYWQMENTKIDGGADIRFTSLKRLEGTKAQEEASDFKEQKFFLMNADIGLRYRPIGHSYHFVYESRFLGGPRPNNADGMVNTEKTRSLYFMRDNLPYATYAQYGYYRPLFGHYTPDHYALAQVMTGAALGAPVYNLLYRTASIGGAPNVPYWNAHYISKDMSNSNLKDKTAGTVLNGGFRGVTLGWNLNYSYWNTKNETTPDNDINVEMHSLYAGAIFLDRTLWLNLEMLSIERDDKSSDKRLGGVWTFETKYRFWREFYWTGSYAQANTTPDIKEGDSSQIQTGVRTFLTPGVDVEWTYSATSHKAKGASAENQRHLMTNLHLYY